VRRGARRQAPLLGAAILLGLAALALAAPLIAPYPPETQDLARRLEPPSREHPLGRDDVGRDVLSRLIWGTRISLTTGLLVVLFSGSLGVLAGASAAYAGGRSDVLMVGLVDVLLSFPGILLAISLVAILGPNLLHLILALCAVGWVAYARLARSLVGKLKGMDFVEAARALGGIPAGVVARHLLPNLLGPVTVQAALGLGGAILAEAGLSFLGLGVPPPAPSWGSMLRSGSQNLLDAPHLAIVPGGAIFIAVMGANLLADGMGRRLDPGGAVARTPL
jgi:peptide/nickel transport system permease protein